jgi:quinol monooxygenase YgiN
LPITVDGRPTEHNRRDPEVAFIQIIDFNTDRIEEIRSHAEELIAKTSGRRTTQRSILCRDRNDPNHFVNVVFFDSYESAMENSNLPETAEFAEKMAGLLSGEPSYLDLDVEWEQDD